MLDSLQRFLQRRQAPADPESALISQWARERGDEFKRVRRGPGAVVQSTGAAGPMRIEWGPPQRQYIRGSELRVRIDAKLPDALEMLVLSRSLAESLEAQAFQELTSLQQTGMDEASPEEARWLALFERIDIPAGPAFEQGFVVVSSCVPHARHWAAGELAVRLLRARSHWLAAQAPLVLMTLRGRLYLRTEAGVLDETLLDGVRILADAAAVRARKISTRAGRSSPAGAMVGAAAIGAPPAGALQSLEPAGKGPAVASVAAATASAIPGLATFESDDPLEDFELDGLHDADLPGELPPLGEPIDTDLTL